MAKKKLTKRKVAKTKLPHLKARSLVLVDEKGKTRIEMQAASDGASISMRDSKRARLELVMSDDGRATINFFDSEDRSIFSMGISSDAAGMSIRDKQGNSSLHIRVPLVDEYGPYDVGQGQIILNNPVSGEQYLYPPPDDKPPKSP